MSHPGGRRYYVTVNPEQELGLLLFAQRNGIVHKTNGEVLESDRQHTIHDAIQMLIDGQAKIEKLAIQEDAKEEKS